jgi:organic hydroperoxide reductase OsmC/OhrA
VSERSHNYTAHIIWTGNLGQGTASYKAFTRDHVWQGVGQADVPLSSDPAFRGDATRHNPEDMLVASVSSCHMLWYLHLCAVAGIVVVSYEDEAQGVMAEDAAGSGRFTSIVLHPRIVIAAGSDHDKALALHHKAHENCFIANSLNFPVTCAPVVTFAS